MKYRHITLSGNICSGKSTVAQLLHKKLGWKFYSTGKYFREKAKKEGLSLYSAEEQNDAETRIADDYVASLLKNKEHYVIDAWLGGYLARNMDHVYRLYIADQEETRIYLYSQREGISDQKAAKQIHERERFLLSKLRAIYKTDDFFNSKHYNRVFETDNLPPEVIVDEIIKAVQS